MARDALRNKLIRIFSKRFPGPEDRVIVRSGAADFLHLYIVSKKFKGDQLKAGEETIWPVLFRELNEEEWGRVSLTVGISPDEINGLVPELHEYLQEENS